MKETEYGCETIVNRHHTATTTIDFDALADRFIAAFALSEQKTFADDAQITRRILMVERVNHEIQESVWRGGMAWNPSGKVQALLHYADVLRMKSPTMEQLDRAINQIMAHRSKT